MAKDTTRLSIIREGARLIHSRGYNHTGLSDILQAAGVPKGSFYFYFKSKDDFGLALVDHYWEFIRGMGETYLSDSSIPPLERLAGFMDAYQEVFEKMKLRCGCPIGNLMHIGRLSLGIGRPSDQGREANRALEWMAAMYSHIPDRGDNVIPCIIKPEGNEKKFEHTCLLLNHRR